MISFGLNVLLLVFLGVIAWQVSKYILKGIVSLITLGAVTLALAPKAYLAAKAERSLQPRDLAFDFHGSVADAKLFNTIVNDRLSRTRVVSEYPDQAWAATNFGRRFA